MEDSQAESLLLMGLVKTAANKFPKKAKQLGATGVMAHVESLDDPTCSRAKMLASRLGGTAESMYVSMPGGAASGSSSSSSSTMRATMDDHVKSGVLLWENSRA